MGGGKFLASKKRSRVRKCLIGLSGLIVIVAGISLAAWLAIPTSPRQSTSQVATIQLKTKVLDSRGDSDQDKSSVVKAYQSDFDKLYDELVKSDPSAWSKTDVYKAQFCLVYAHKIDLYQQEQTIIGLLYQAEQTGVNVYGDGLYLTKQQVESILIEVNNRRFGGDTGVQATN